METLEQKLIEELQVKIQYKKDAIVIERLREIGLEHLFLNIGRKRFPGLTVIIKNNEETWYADDGSDNGKRVVTFKINSPELNYELSSYKMIEKIEYY